MKGFGDEYRRRLDTVDVEPDFAENVRRRAGESSAPERADMPRRAGDAATFVRVSSGTPQGRVAPSAADLVPGRAQMGSRPPALLRRVAVVAAAAAAVAVAVFVGLPAVTGTSTESEDPDVTQVQPSSPFSFDLKAALAYADDAADETGGNDAVEPLVYGPVSGTGFTGLYLEGAQDASRRCFTASFRIDLSCVGEAIECVDYQLLGENGLGVEAADREALMASDYVVEEDYAGCAWFFTNDRGEAVNTRFGSAFSGEVPEATSKVSREIVVATPLTPEYDKQARKLAAAMSPETYSNVDDEIMTLGYLSCVDKLSDLCISVTAHFSDGSEQTKVYRLRLDGDRESVLNAWREAQLSRSETGGSHEDHEPRFLTFVLEDAAAQ